VQVVVLLWTLPWVLDTCSDPWLPFEITRCSMWYLLCCVHPLLCNSFGCRHLCTLGIIGVKLLGAVTSMLCRHPIIFYVDVLPAIITLFSRSKRGKASSLIVQMESAETTSSFSCRCCQNNSGPTMAGISHVKNIAYICLCHLPVQKSLFAGQAPAALSLSHTDYNFFVSTLELCCYICFCGSTCAPPARVR
jgi:hypothetical protein